MMDVWIIMTDQNTVGDYINSFPPCYRPQLARYLRVLRGNGRDCIGAFVNLLPADEELYFFTVTTPIEEKEDIRVVFRFDDNYRIIYIIEFDY